MKNIEIVIVGAGPAGLSAAIELSKLGYKDIVVFDREDEAGGTPRHCGHLGFGLFEFKRVLSGPKYAKKLVKTAQKLGVKIELKSTLMKTNNHTLTFSTPDGVKEFYFKKLILALGARETPRPSQFVSGVRSPNIITTGALQRFVYMQKRVPFKNAVIIGSEAVSFSAILTAKHAGINIKALIEEDKSINSFCILKPFAKYILQTPIKTGVQIVEIKGDEKKISGIKIVKNSKEEFIECDGIIFTGKFTPQSSVLQSSFESFNYHNNSLFVSEDFKIKEKDVFIVGNLLRGALAAFKCYFEGKSVAKSVHESFEEKKSTYIEIKADDNIQWYHPSLVDICNTPKLLTTLRLKKRAKGVIKIMHNNKQIFQKSVDAYPYKSIDIPWISDLNLKDRETLKVEFQQSPR